LIAVRGAQVTVWAGPELVYQDLTPGEEVDVERSRTIGTGAYVSNSAGLASHIAGVSDEGDVATVVCTGAEPPLSARVLLDRQQRRVEIDRAESVERAWVANSATARVDVIRGAAGPGPVEYRPDYRVGYGLLDVIPTDERTYPTARGAAVDGHLTIVIS
jgi:hypothetical protein